MHTPVRALELTHTSRVKRPRVQVVYIDKDHLHLYAGTSPQAQESVARDLTGN